MIAPAHCICARIQLTMKSPNIFMSNFFFKNEVSRGVIRIVKIYTDDNLSDILTKVVTIAKFKKCLDLVGACKL